MTVAYNRCYTLLMVKSKSTTHYIGLRYRIILTPEDDGWGAVIDELPGCVGGGDTIQEAITMLEDAKLGWFQSALDHNDPIPGPRYYGAEH